MVRQSTSNLKFKGLNTASADTERKLREKIIKSGKYAGPVGTDVYEMYFSLDIITGNRIFSIVVAIYNELRKVHT